MPKKTKQDIANRFGQDVATQIRPTSTFYAAEDYHQDYHTKNPISYKYYKWNCGRAQRLFKIWGDKHKHYGNETAVHRTRSRFPIHIDV